MAQEYPQPTLDLLPPPAHEIFHDMPHAVYDMGTLADSFSDAAAMEIEPVSRLSAIYVADSFDDFVCDTAIEDTDVLGADECMLFDAANGLQACSPPRWDEQHGGVGEELCPAGVNAAWAPTGEHERLSSDVLHEWSERVGSIFSSRALPAEQHVAEDVGGGAEHADGFGGDGELRDEQHVGEDVGGTDGFSGDGELRDEQHVGEDDRDWAEQAGGFGGDCELRDEQHDEEDGDWAEHANGFGSDCEVPFVQHVGEDDADAAEHADVFGGDPDGVPMDMDDGVGGVDGEPAEPDCWEAVFAGVDDDGGDHDDDDWNEAVGMDYPAPAEQACDDVGLEYGAPSEQVCDDDGLEYGAPAEQACDDFAASAEQAWVDEVGLDYGAPSEQACDNVGLEYGAPAEQAYDDVTAHAGQAWVGAGMDWHEGQAWSNEDATCACVFMRVHACMHAMCAMCAHACVHMHVDAHAV
jgi:hypothetical protein